MKVVSLFVVCLFIACAAHQSMAYPTDALYSASDNIPPVHEFIEGSSLSYETIESQRTPDRLRRAADDRFQGNLGINHGNLGTDVNAAARANLWQSTNGRNDLHGQVNYGQHFGGPAGRQPPNYGAGLQFTHRF